MRCKPTGYEARGDGKEPTCCEEAHADGNGRVCATKDRSNPDATQRPEIDEFRRCIVHLTLARFIAHLNTTYYYYSPCYYVRRVALRYFVAAPHATSAALTLFRSRVASAGRDEALFSENARTSSRNHLLTGGCNTP